MQRPGLFLLLTLLALTAISCQPTPPTNAGPRTSSSAGSPASAAAPSVSRQTIAYLNSEPVSWHDLQQGLIEAAGGTVLAEWVLHHQVQRRLTQAGQSLTLEQIEQEKQLFLSELAENDNEAAQLLRELKQLRGEQSFERRMTINAGLRLLVQPEVQVTDLALQQAFARTYGPQHQVRLITTATLPEAVAVVAKARQGEPFVDLAIAHSTDASAAQGGLLPLINLEDATWPTAIRNALGRMEAGQVSDPIALDQGFAVIRLEKKIAAQPVQFDDVKEQLAVQVQRQAQQMLMQRLARTLLREAELTILDPALQKSWQLQLERMLQPEVK